MEEYENEKLASDTVLKLMLGSTSGQTEEITTDRNFIITNSIKSVWITMFRETRSQQLESIVGIVRIFWLHSSTTSITFSTLNVV